jgi:peptidoglycan/LPS O-acetylase OafA/YrhL
MAVLDTERVEPVEQLTLARDRDRDRTDTVNRSTVVDMVRAVAALMVLVAHSSFISAGRSGDDLTATVRQGLGDGVLLFFVLSGYLIAGPYLRALVSGAPFAPASGYLLRRAARIYPAYWIAFFAVVVLLAPDQGVQPWQVPVHALLLHSSWPVLGEPTAIYFVSWTLGIEAVFYLLVPVAAAALRAIHPRPWSVRSLALVVVGLWAASAFWHTETPRLGLGARLDFALQIGIPVWVFAFCPGMLIALMAMGSHGAAWARVKRFLRQPVPIVGIAAGLWALAHWTQYGGSGLPPRFYTPILSVACGLLVNLALTAGSWIRRPAQLLAPIGLISYGIYLWHYVVIEMLRRHSRIGFRGGVGAWLGDVLIVLALTLPIAAFSWFRVERPLMRRAAAWARRRRNVVAPEAATA